MKKLLLILCLVFVVIAGSTTWVYLNTKPVSGETAVKNFLILKGTAASVVGNNLQEAGLISNSLVFKLYLYVSGRQKSLIAGEYGLSPNLSLFEIVNQLTHGPKEIWVTIPEGLRKEEIAEKYIKTFGLEADAASSFRSEFLLAASGKEGYLFPDTYLFAKDVTATLVVTKMLTTFDKKAAEVTHNQLVMASLIERETRTDAERPIVAGILYKRIAIGMPLQVDATVQYAVVNSKIKDQNSKVENFWPEITLEDRKINSAFNTYQILGLPPAPIANPGLSAIKAAINPEKSNYLYYLHDAQGVIRYASTLEEHNQNIRKYLGS